MRTFAIFNRKGGVAKTTTAVNLAYILATSCKLRVLLADADSQGNAGSIIAGDRSDGMSGILTDFGDFWDEYICHTDVPGLDVLPAGDGLGDLDLACMTGKMEPSFHALRGFLEAVAEDDAYDVCIIDCPPYFSLSCLNALTAADRVIIPTDVSAHSVAGMQELVDQIDTIRQAVPGLCVSGALVTNYVKSDLAEDAMDYLRSERIVPLFRTTIRHSPKVAESTWSRSPVCVWSPFSATSKDMRAWAEELLEKEGVPV